jgi:hypothetical protein
MSGASDGFGSAITREQAAEIVADPNGFYVNIHSTNHPDGAVRGQLDNT